jgi:hypothetical protein
MHTRYGLFAEYADDICLGAKLKTLDCEAQYGSCAFDVVSNRSFRVDIIEGSEWLGFPDVKSLTRKLSRNTPVDLAFTSNNGYRRLGRIVLSAGTRRDTLSVRQEGIYRERIGVDDTAFDVPAEGGVYTTRVRTNLLPGDLLFEADKSRVGNYVYADNLFSFTVEPSRSRDVRTVTVRIYTLDGWGEKVGADIVLTQQAGRN